MKQVEDNETELILEMARECLGREGDFVELGCYEGDTSLLIAEELHRHFLGHTQGRNPRPKGRTPKPTVQENGDCSSPKQRLWIYDSFEGLPSKTREDESEAGRNFQEGVLMVSKREVKARFLRAGLPVPVIKKGWFSDLTETDMPPEIAFAFLDGDLYQSIKDSLRLVEDKMADNGIIIVHDYDNIELPGVTKAVDEWRAKNPQWKMERRYSLAILKKIGK